jgi:uncharacterized protein YbjT (DUF2867 family)
MQNLLRAADAIRTNGCLAAPMGRGRFPLVDTRDIGAAAAIVLANPMPHAGQTYALTGPAALSYHDIATAFSAVAGRPVRYEPVSPQAYEARLLAAGIPGWRAFDLAHIASAYRPSNNAVSLDLPQLLGRRPRSLSEFLEDHLQSFTETGRRASGSS